MRRALTVRRRLAAVAVAALSLAACGTTVPTGATTAAKRPQSADEGLAVPPQVVGDLPADELGSGLDPAGPDIPSFTPPRSAGGAQPTAATAPTRGSAPIRAADRRPIKVGFMSTNNDAAASFGVDNEQSFVGRRVWEALVAAWNERGGIAGRKIEPVYAELRSSSRTYSADLEAECARFTDDEHVSLVLSSTGVYFDSYAQCLNAHRVPVMSADYGLGDDESLRTATSYFAVETLTPDARLRVLLEQLVATKRITSSDQIGVVVEGCPYNQRAYDRTLVPLAKRLGLTLTDTVVGRCFEGIDAFGGMASDMQNAVLRFQTRSVTQVVFVSGSNETNLVLLFTTAAEAQSFRPGYAITSAAAPSVHEGSGTPKAQLARAVGLGWLPALDTTRSADLKSPAISACLADLAKGGVTPASPADRFTAYGFCDTFSIADATLRRTGGTTDLSDVTAAVHSLGSSVDLASTYAGNSDFSRGRRAGPSTGRLFAWDVGCGCFDYTGQPFSLLPR